MLWKKFSKIILVASITSLLLTNCTENSINPVITESKLIKIEPEEIYPFDVVTIYGENLGSPSDSASIYLDSLLLINSKLCLQWNNNFIKFIAPKKLFKGNLQIIYGSKDTTNSIIFNGFAYPRILFSEVPAGKFQMGSNSGLAFEQPVHEVELTQAFFISKYEITQKQWLTVLDSNPSYFIGDNLPVANIEWELAIRFCNELSKMFNLDTCYIIEENKVVWDTNANGYRLPTEAEWEYACRAGTTGDFAGNGNPLDIGWFDINSGAQPHPVGRKLPNSWGIYDMQGNVWEWCWDWFEPFYYQKSPRTNPKGPETGSNHVIRGGSWQRGPSFGRASSRTFPEDQKTNFGLRIVRTKLN